MPKYTFFPCSFQQFQPPKRVLFSPKRTLRFDGKRRKIAQKEKSVAASGEFFRPSMESNRRFAKTKRRRNLLNRRFGIIQPRFRRSLIKRQGEWRICKNVKCFDWYWHLVVTPLSILTRFIVWTYDWNKGREETYRFRHFVMDRLVRQTTFVFNG